jgi:hypothetical protein
MDQLFNMDEYQKVAGKYISVVIDMAVEQEEIYQ